MWFWPQLIFLFAEGNAILASVFLRFRGFWASLPVLLATCVWAAAQTALETTTSVAPPTADKRPVELKAHGLTRVDEYYWMRQRDDPEVLAYLNAENDYFEAMMADTGPLQETLFNEIKGRIKQTDQSVPYPENGYEYYTRTIEGKQYPIYCRRRLFEGNGVPSGEATEQTILDVNLLAQGHPFCSVASVKVSPNARLLAYAVDLVGRRKYSIRVVDLETGQKLPDTVREVTGNLVWAEDNQTVYYTRQDPQTLRSYQVFRHRIGTDSADDPLVYEEQDPEFSCQIAKSRSRQYIFINCDQTLSTETRYLDARDPASTPRLFLPREVNHEYSVDHLGDDFYVRTNWQAKNFRLMKAKVSVATADRTRWREVVPTSAEAYLADFALFDDFLAIQVRSRALVRIRIIRQDGTPPYELDFGEPCYVAALSPTEDTSTPWLRYFYSSLTTPPSTVEYNVVSRVKRVLKEQEILGGFDKNNYRTQRLWATARDGTQIPVSIVYHKQTPLDGTAPCLQYGYGSYGASMDPMFDAARLNLLDRGFVYAIAHVRGGQELGRSWYEDGKLLKKKNTFRDFVDVGKFLINEQIAAPDRLFARGGSAGGLLMGAVINMEPGLYRGVIADVPFVDVITTMLDDTIPLTTAEYDEWGNPHEKAYYDYMVSYSPYDNVVPRRYPHLLVTTGLQDSQVQYWEPAKWVARLRDNNRGDSIVLLKTNMGAGHGGASGRYDRYREAAMRDAFLLMLSKINH